MAINLGSGVSYVNENEGYNYDLVVFQKGKPPLDSELNLAQELQNIIAGRNLRSLPSGWLSAYTPYANRELLTLNPKLVNSFYTQNPSGAKPEFALVNGQVVYVTNSTSAYAPSVSSANLITLDPPPNTGNNVNGVFLEVWRALLDPSSNLNKPGVETVTDDLNDMFMIDSNKGWICGTNGLILKTSDGGVSWPVIAIDTKRSLNGIHFYNSNFGWVVGDSGVMARSSSAGATWALLNSATLVNLNSVYAVSQNIVWAVGDSGVVLKASNGVTFSPVSSGVTVDLNEVYFCSGSTTAQMHGWIVGNNGTILRTANGGATWTRATSGTTQNLNSVYFYNVNFGFAVGDNGTILRSSDGGITWITQISNTTRNLYDVNLFPKLDDDSAWVTPEEVSSQLGATGNSFTVGHIPVTGADRKGVITNNPADVTVTVNDVPVIVQQVNGSTGKVILATAPGVGAVTKIHYYYQSNCAVFQGKAWAVGATGTVLYTSDIGSSWAKQTPANTYDLNAVSFVSQTNGWLCGSQSVINVTNNSGATWTSQVSDLFSRQVSRVYCEGNLLTDIYPNEDSIHPDVQIETTARVQVQYKIRVIEAVDALSNPEAGLNSNVLGQGPNNNAINGFPYENMGPINGDYGCWRAKCIGTVDGYVYAVPMFFVARRNTGNYSLPANPNGQHNMAESVVRPDFLLAANVISGDVLDVRRKVVSPSVEELFAKTFDALSANTLSTNLGRSADEYGSELLKVDTITGEAPLLNAVQGLYNSGSGFLNSDTTGEDVIVNPGSIGLINNSLINNGLYHPDPSFFNSEYIAPGSVLGTDGKRIPGRFMGLGTSDASFEFSPQALTKPLDSGLEKYIFHGKYISNSTNSLTYVPSNPQIVTNLNPAKTDAFIYQGVLNTEESKILETWDSDIPGYPNYAVAYATQDSSNVNQTYRASPVEVHYFKQVLSTGSVLTIPRYIPVDSGTVKYNIFTVREVLNKTAGYTHKLSSVEPNTTDIIITAASGFSFISGHILEITAEVLSDTGISNIRNGAVVNFDSRLRGINNFTQSPSRDNGKYPLHVATATGGYNITLTDNILGWSTTETVDGLHQDICWDSFGMKPTVVTRDSLNSITLDPTGLSGDATIQLLIQKNTLDFYTGSLNIAYRYNPYQSQQLSSTLIVEPVTGNTNIYISTAGSGGGPDAEPYELPLEHIPVYDTQLNSDNIFNNFVQLKFSNFMVDSGFVQMPVNIPGNFYGSTITLSSPLQDNLSRTFYSVCSRELRFQTEGLKIPAPRKVYVPILARVTVANSMYVAGEYVLLVFSRPVINEIENVTGYFPNGDCSISVYRLPNRPISRVLAGI